MAARAGISASVRAVTKRKITATRAPLVLTEAAVKRAKKLIEQEPSAVGLKIGVKTRGCNGLSYTLGYMLQSDKKGNFDEEVQQDGVKIVVDAKALLTILGTEMDFVEEKLKSEFIFNNPNIKGTCGCGESFNV